MANLMRTNGGAPVRSVFSDFFSDVDRFFENDFWGMPSRMGRQMMANVPATNIRENEKEYSIEVAAPGMKKDDFNIEVNEGMLTISSQREEEKKDEQENFTRREYNYSSFSRSFRLPESVKQENIKARYQDGVLHVSVPKSKEKERANRRINIE
ncbi:Hsp20/alpha crystallin family protein [Pontibacter mangrovi]|uniref:Hsp20/alpha crystallin family protein n=1 Tax=Pontibacter mangrovi TaxID=2589816 RepID=A0A501WAT3_9BACT|nr:Hsp20/alpha crystallin family protein [Pontibacter mangrovi]TPE45460.1 Hsp20/alpha crystallin family protein [Pontibacter mangrovi]